MNLKKYYEGIAYGFWDEALRTYRVHCDASVVAYDNFKYPTWLRGVISKFHYPATVSGLPFIPYTREVGVFAEQIGNIFLEHYTWLREEKLDSFMFGFCLAQMVSNHLDFDLSSYDAKFGTAYHTMISMPIENVLRSAGVRIIAWKMDGKIVHIQTTTWPIIQL